MVQICLHATRLMRPHEHYACVSLLHACQCDEPSGSTPAPPPQSSPPLLLSSYPQVTRICSTWRVTRDHPSRCCRPRPALCPRRCTSPAILRARAAAFPQVHHTPKTKPISSYFLRHKRETHALLHQVDPLRRTGKNCDGLQAAHSGAAAHPAGFHCHRDAREGRARDDACGGCGRRAVRGAAAWLRVRV